MNINNQEDVIQLVKEDHWMMDVLYAAHTLNLPDWWVCAGFVRSKLWDVLHHFEERTPLPDVDVIYFDPQNMDERVEKELEQKLREINPHIPWSVKNEARMHVVNQIPPYLSSVDAISKFPETATALGLTLDTANQVILTAPCGIEDALHMVIRPSPYFQRSRERMKIYEARIGKKNWKSIWHQVSLV